MKKCIYYTFHLFLFYAVLLSFSLFVRAEEPSSDPVVRIEQPEENKSGPVIQGIYEIASAADNAFILDIKNCTVQDTDFKSLQLFHPFNVNQQKFYLESLSGTGWRISALHSGDALTALSGPDGSSSAAMAALERSEDADVPEDQIWFLENAADDALYIRSSSGKYLTLGADYAYLGAPVILSEFTGNSNQKWQLNKTWISPDAEADTDLPNPYAEDGQYRNLRISLNFNSKYETLTAADLAGHMIETEDHQMVLDSDFLTSYLEDLAQKYDTQGVPRKFKTSYGSEITLYKGDFGWKLDVEKTKELLLEHIRANKRKTLSPIWAHEGGSMEKGNDIGDSYIEIDLTNQKVWLYKDGAKLLETDCVSGTYGTDRQTPGGVYSIFYMKSPAVLKGADYTSPVEYWMAYNGNIGLHDANWRSSFGGSIYKTDGSHGCVNLPTEAAKLIYETVDYGYPVVSYN